MSRIGFEKKDCQLILCYETESDWIEEKLEKDNLVKKKKKKKYEYFL